MENDYISRQAAIDLAHEFIIPMDEYGQYNQGINNYCAEIIKLPSAQPEIIMCRDCRWQKDQSGSTAWLPCMALVTPSDFYCGRAERRTDGQTD